MSPGRHPRLLSCVGATAAAIILVGCGDATQSSAAPGEAGSASSAAPASRVAPPSASDAAVAVVAHPDPQALLASDDPALAANKRLVFDMWRTMLNAGHLERADDFVAEDYIQHSPFQRSGRQALKDVFAVIPRSETVPETMRPPPVAFVAEDDLVVFVAVEELPEPDGAGSYTTTHFNLFRIRAGRLAEHWHPDQTPPCPDLPAADAGGPQPVTGAAGSGQIALLEAASPALAVNKRLVFDYWRQIAAAGREELAPLYLARDYIEHSPARATGLAATMAYLANREDRPIGMWLDSELVAVIAEGGLVVLVTRLELPNPYQPGATYTTASFDMFRIADGRIAEHWDAAVKPGTEVEEFGATCGAAAE